MSDEPSAPTHRPGRKAGALVVLIDGALALYLERGGRTALSYGTDPEHSGLVAEALAREVRQGRLGSLTVTRIDGAPALGQDHPLATALTGAGFHTAPQGLRLRR